MRFSSETKVEGGGWWVVGQKIEDEEEKREKREQRCKSQKVGEDIVVLSPQFT